MLKATSISTNIRRYFYVLDCSLATWPASPHLIRYHLKSPQLTSFDSLKCSLILGESIKGRRHLAIQVYDHIKNLTLVPFLAIFSLHSVDVSLLCWVSFYFFNQLSLLDKLPWFYALMVTATSTWFTSFWHSSISFHFYWGGARGEPYSHIHAFSDMNEESNPIYTVSR